MGGVARGHGGRQLALGVALLGAAWRGAAAPRVARDPAAPQAFPRSPRTSSAEVTARATAATEAAARANARAAEAAARAAEARFPQAVAAGTSAKAAAASGAAEPGAVVLGREDLQQLRDSVLRISGELQSILGVLDARLAVEGASAARAPEAPVSAPPGSGGAPGGSPAGANRTSDGAGSEAAPEEESAAWMAGRYAFEAAVFLLDVGLWVSMQLFLESLGRKRSPGGSILAKDRVSTVMAAKAERSGDRRALIPSPTGAAPSEARQRLPMLSQEEALAALLDAHFAKMVAGAVLAVLCRLPPHILDANGLICHVMSNLVIMLRCMSLVTLCIRDDMSVPRQNPAVGRAGVEPPDTAGEVSSPPSRSPRSRGPSPRRRLVDTLGYHTHVAAQPSAESQ